MEDYRGGWTPEDIAYSKKQDRGRWWTLDYEFSLGQMFVLLFVSAPVIFAGILAVIWLLTWLSCTVWPGC